MKNTATINFKKATGQIIIISILSVLLCLMIFVLQTNPVFSADVFDALGNSGEIAQESIKTLVEKVVGLAIVICCLCMIFTRDDKKLQMEKTLLKWICVAFFIIELVCGKDSILLNTVNKLLGN